jgi:hypothetical protein
MSEFDKLIVAVFLSALVVALPSVFAERRRTRRLKKQLVQTLIQEDRWTQDFVLSDLDAETRNEILKKLGRDASQQCSAI